MQSMLVTDAGRGTRWFTLNEIGLEVNASAQATHPGPIRISGDDHLYAEDCSWGAGRLVGLGWVSAAQVDARGRVVILQRQTPNLVIVDRDGAYVGAVDVPALQDAHGIFIADDDTTFLVDRDAHQVMRLDTDAGAVPLTGSGPRLCHPTGVAVDRRSGDIFVSDGYGGAKVHRFRADGEPLGSWGRHGTGAGEFNLVHAVAVDPGGRVLVADCANNRVQVFTPEGECIEIWDDFQRPLGIHVDERRELVSISEGSTRLTIRNLGGEVVASGRAPNTAHGICGDADGSLYLSIPSMKTVVKLVPVQAG